MIGVTHCKDPNVIDKEDLDRTKWVFLFGD